MYHAILNHWFTILFSSCISMDFIKSKPSIVRAWKSNDTNYTNSLSTVLPRRVLTWIRMFIY